MKQLTPMKAIRAKCLSCTCDQPKEVRLCPIVKCPLYVYRFGRRPNVEDLSVEDHGEEKS